MTVVALNRSRRHRVCEALQRYISRWRKTHRPRDCVALRQLASHPRRVVSPCLKPMPNPNSAAWLLPRHNPFPRRTSRSTTTVADHHDPRRPARSRLRCWNTRPLSFGRLDLLTRSSAAVIDPTKRKHSDACCVDRPTPRLCRGGGEADACGQQKDTSNPQGCQTTPEVGAASGNVTFAGVAVCATRCHKPRWAWNCPGQW